VYDTFYAMVDRDDDVKLGVQSTAIAFGDMDLMIIGVMQAMILGGLLLAGRALHLHWPFYAALAAGAALFAWQQWLARKRDRDGCFKAFLHNNWFGLVITAGIAFA
jgi:4-hydroxybenzoate polyprenyltransferase